MALDLQGICVPRGFSFFDYEESISIPLKNRLAWGSSSVPGYRGIRETLRDQHTYARIS